MTGLFIWLIASTVAAVIVSRWMHTSAEFERAERDEGEWR